MIFTLVYGYAAARSKRAERVLLPLLDVLQSVPILSFLPVVLLALAAVLPERIAAELAAVVLIFTSQAWNMTFSLYQSLTTVADGAARGAAVSSVLSGWLRFRALELPFAAIGLIWNSMMSWAGGWFFLMAAEIFSVGGRDFRLPGLGAYLQRAASRGDLHAVAWASGTLVLIIVLLDQLVWRPLLAWAERFKVETVGGEEPPHSWFFRVVQRSRLAALALLRRARGPAGAIDAWIAAAASTPRRRALASAPRRRPWMRYVRHWVSSSSLAYRWRPGRRLLAPRRRRRRGRTSGSGWWRRCCRVALALTRSRWPGPIPVGVLIGVSPRAGGLAAAAGADRSPRSRPRRCSPSLLLVSCACRAGLNMAAVLLMLMGTQWYLLFNVIAGASAIPQDLKYTVGAARSQPAGALAHAAAALALPIRHHRGDHGQRRRLERQHRRRIHCTSAATR